MDIHRRWQIRPYPGCDRCPGKLVRDVVEKFLGFFRRARGGLLDDIIHKGTGRGFIQGFAGLEGVIAFKNLLDQHSNRPAVGHQMVHLDKQPEILATKSQDKKIEQRAVDEGPRLSGFAFNPATELVGSTRMAEIQE